MALVLVLVLVLVLTLLTRKVPGVQRTNKSMQDRSCRCANERGACGTHVSLSFYSSILTSAGSFAGAAAPSGQCNRARRQSCGAAVRWNLRLAIAVALGCRSPARRGVQRPATGGIGGPRPGDVSYFCDVVLRGEFDCCVRLGPVGFELHRPRGHTCGKRVRHDDVVVHVAFAWLVRRDHVRSTFLVRRKSSEARLERSGSCAVPSSHASARFSIPTCVLRCKVRGLNPSSGSHMCPKLCM